MDDAHEEMTRLADEFADRTEALGFGLALVLIDKEEGVQVGMNTANVSEATVCVGMLVKSILDEGPPACPHCLNNYRRLEKALRVMRDHPASPAAHSLH